MTMVAFGSAPPPPDPLPPAMPPGAYLQLRRLAAGFTVEEVARCVVYDCRAGRPVPAVTGPAAVDGVAAQLRRIEADDPLMSAVLVHALRRVFRFDREVYDQLVLLRADPAADLPRPMICRGCGCTWHDPCDHPTLGACAWAETPVGAPHICTVCLLTGPANDA